MDYAALVAATIAATGQQGQLSRRHLARHHCASASSTARRLVANGRCFTEQHCTQSPRGTRQARRRRQHGRAFRARAYAPIGRRNAVLQHNHRPRFLVAEDEAACKQMTVHLGWCFRKQLSVGQRGGRVKQQQPWSRKSLRKQFKFSTRPSGVALHRSLPEHGDCIVTLLFQHGIRRWHAGGRTGRTRPAPPMTGSWLPLQLYKHLAQHPSARACSCTSQQSLTRSTG